MRMLSPDEVLARAGHLEVAPDAVERAVRLIREGGAMRPVMIDRAGRIVGGASRVMAARQMGLAEVPVVTLGEARAQRAARIDGVDGKAGSLGILGALVWRPAIFSRHDASWASCRSWRWSSKKADLRLFKAAKAQRPRVVIDGAAHDICVLLERLGGGWPGYSVTAMPCGNSGRSDCFGRLLGESVAAELGLPFSPVFEDRLVAGSSSHPQKYTRLPPLVVKTRPTGPVILIDDLATTGLHMEEALGALRHLGIATFGIVWLSGDMR